MVKGTEKHYFTESKRSYVFPIHSHLDSFRTNSQCSNKKIVLPKRKVFSQFPIMQSIGIPISFDSTVILFTQKLIALVQLIH